MSWGLKRQNTVEVYHNWKINMDNDLKESQMEEKILVE